MDEAEGEREVGKEGGYGGVVGGATEKGKDDGGGQQGRATRSEGVAIAALLAIRNADQRAAPCDDEGASSLF